MPVGAFDQFRRQSFHLMSEQDADREIRLPVEQIHGVVTGFNRGDLIVARVQVLKQGQRGGEFVPKAPSPQRPVLSWKSPCEADRP